MVVGKNQYEFCALSETHPQIAERIHPTSPHQASEVSKGSTKIALWGCEKDARHVWSARIDSVVRQNSKCAVCAGRTIIQGVNDLATIRPDVAKLFHESSPVKPSQVAVSSNKKAVFHCGHDNHQPWETKIYHVVSGSGCPNCAATNSSLVEKSFTALLRKYIPDLESNCYMRIGNKRFNVDGHSLVYKLVFEYDGEYWHRYKTDVDEKKTTTLLEREYRVIRIREKPLSSLNIRHPNLLQLSHSWIRGNVVQESIEITISNWLYGILDG